MKAPVSIAIAALWLASCSVSPESATGRYLGPEMGNGQDHLELTADGHYVQKFYLIGETKPFAVNQGTWTVQRWPSEIRLHRPMSVNDFTPEKIIGEHDLRLRVGQCGGERCLQGLDPDRGRDYRLQAEGDGK
ncbi:MAG: hypothetical protein HY859_19960 [Caulobacterales bacterium]|nr:hypothetical protein [Caulobacterales bacterium]